MGERKPRKPKDTAEQQLAFKFTGMQKVKSRNLLELLPGTGKLVQKKVTVPL
jgi:hypothetical protein